jgi:hypothetical protein
MVDEATYPEGDTRNQTWPEYFKKTLGKASESAQKYGSALVHGLNPANISETIEGMGKQGRGAIYNFMGEDYLPPNAGKPMPVDADTPVKKMIARRQGFGENLAQIQEEKDIASDVGKGLAPVFKYTRDKGYQGFDPEKWQQFADRFQEDPVGTLALNAAPFSGLGGGLSKLGSTGARIAESANLPVIADALSAAKTAGNVLEKTKYADPLTAGLGVLGSAGKGVVGAASNLSGVQEFKPIMDLYAKSGKEGRVARGAFEEFSSGNGDYNSFLNQLNDEIKTVHQGKLKEWGDRKGNLQNNPIDLTDVEAAMVDATAAKGSRKYVGDETRAAIDKVERPDGLFDRLSKLKDLPDTDPSRKLFGVDQYKQSLWDEINAANKRGDSALVDILNPVYKKVSEVISKYGDSEYATLMDDYQNIVSEMRDIQTASGSKKPSVSQFRTILSNRKNPVGRSILDDIVKRNPYLEGAFLGDIHRSTAKPFKASIVDVASIPAAAAAQYYHPYGAAAVAALEMGKLGLSSPSLTTGIAKKIGAMDRNLITGSAKSLVDAAPTAAKTIAPFQGAMESAYDRRINKMQEEDAQKQLQQYMEEDAVRNQAEGGRVGRKTGGRTMSKDPIAKAMALIAMADRIKKEQGKDTSSLLNLDDTTVAKALAVANRGI